MPEIWLKLSINVHVRHGCELASGHRMNKRILNSKTLQKYFYNIYILY